MSDDLNSTNGLDKVFNKFINAKKIYSENYYQKPINILEKNQTSISDDSDDDNEPIEESFYNKYKHKLQKKQDDFNMERTFINIDSQNRQKTIKYDVISSFNLDNNPFITSYKNETISVLSKNPFQLSDENKTQIIFLNLSNNDDYLNIGINKKYLEFNDKDSHTIYTIVKVIFDNNDDINDTYSSNSFDIISHPKVNKDLIKSSNFGGSQVKCLIVNNIRIGYPFSSHYKIFLDRTFTNVSAVRLISSEIPNTSYTINSNIISSNFQGLNLKTKINNKLYWINEEDDIDTYNVKLYSDEIYLKSLNKNTLFSNYNSEINNLQDIYSNEVWNSIKLNNSLLESFSEITNINSPQFDNNSNKDFFSPIQLTLNTYFRHPDTGLILTSTSNHNNGKYWLNDSYHNFQKTLLYDIENLIIENIEKDTMNSNLYNLKFENPYLYNYYSNLLQTSSKNIDFNINNTYKQINSIGIPKYMGFFIFDLNKSNGINSNDEYIEINNLHSCYIYPSISLLSEKIISPVLFPNDIDKKINLTLKNYKRYPIYNIELSQGKYSEKQFLYELNGKLNKTKQKKFNFINQRFQELSDKFSNKNYFKVNIDNNLIDIRQYQLIDFYQHNNNVNNNIIYYNEGVPYLSIKNINNNLITGDKILIEGFTTKDGIHKEHVNTEHEVIRFPSYKMFIRIIYPLPSKTYLDQNKFFNDNIGKTIDNSIPDQFAYKRDLRKLCIKEDNINGNDSDDPEQYNSSYFGNYIGDGNFYNTQGNSNHSDKEKYPLKTKGDNKNRFYGDFNNLAKYKFGIYNNTLDTLNINDSFNPPLPKSFKNLDDGGLIHRLDVIDKFENNILPDTLQTNMNYFGSKLVNSMNNSFFYPESSDIFLQNEINSQGPQISILENEHFVKLNNTNSIKSETILGKITSIGNELRAINGNFEAHFELISNIKNGNFTIGDIIIGLESSCVAMIVPETWNYDGLPIDDIISKGLGTYLIEKYKNNFDFLNNLVNKSKRGFYEDIKKFSNNLNKWSLEKINNSEKNVYIRIPDIPIKSQLTGVVTKKLKIYKPKKFKFLFENDDDPNKQLNLGDQDFSYSQTNLEIIDKNYIKNSYLLDIYKNTKSNYLVIETNNKHNFKKGDNIYIKDHKLFNKYRNNLLYKTLYINRVIPFRSYLSELQNVFNNLDQEFKQDDTNIIPFNNTNIIYDYIDNDFKYSLGNYNTSSSFIFNKYYESFNSENIYPLSLKYRLINWFFENPFLWNSNNIEKSLSFLEKYKPSLKNKQVIIKIIVCPFDSFGRTFLSTYENEYANINGTSFDNVFLKEGPYYNYNNGQYTEYTRNSSTVMPFLPGMGVYSWNSENENILNNTPYLLGEVVGTSLLSMKDYIDNYNTVSYIDIFPKPVNENEEYIAKQLFDNSSRVPGIGYSISGIKINNSGNNYTEFTKVIFPNPISYQVKNDTFNFQLSSNLNISLDSEQQKIIITPEQQNLLGNLETLDNILLTFMDNYNNDISNDIIGFSHQITIKNIIHNNLSTNIYLSGNYISSQYHNSIINTGLLLLKNFYNYRYKGKLAEGNPIIKNGKIIGVDITEAGGGYNINNSQNLSVTFEDIDGGGIGAEGIISLSRSSSTYAIYIKLNEQMFITNKGIVTGFNEELMEKFKRGNNIYFNTRYLKGDGKIQESGFELNTDSVNNNVSTQADYKSYGNYYWRNRKAAATIYQGYLIHEENSNVTTPSPTNSPTPLDNDLNTPSPTNSSIPGYNNYYSYNSILNNANPLIFNYGEATSELKHIISDDNPDLYYFIAPIDIYYKVYLNAAYNLTFKLYHIENLEEPINSQDNYYISDNILLNENNMYYIEVYGNKNDQYQLFIEFNHNLNYLNINIDSLDYIDISEYFSSITGASGTIELNGLSIGFYGDIDIFTFISEIDTTAIFTLREDITDNSQLIIKIYNANDVNNDISYLINENDNYKIYANVLKNERYYIKIFSNKYLSNNILYNFTGVVTQSPSESQTNIIKKKYYVSGHLEYFYQSFLQNKCIINYSQPLSKEEEIFIHKHQIPVKNKKLEISSEYNNNNINTINHNNKNYTNFENRIYEYNPEVYSIHSFSPFDKIYIYDNIRFKNIYNDLNTLNPVEINSLSVNSSTNNLQQESTGIISGTYDIITSLWNGEYKNKYLFEKINANKNIMINLDFSDSIEKGFLNKGKIRVKGQQLSICGNNSSYYQHSITQDVLLENQFVIVDHLEYNKKGSNYLLIKNGIDTFHTIDSKIKKNDIIVIGAYIYGKDDIYPNQVDNTSVNFISELTIVKNISQLNNGNILIELQSSLINNHSSNEIVVIRYKYGELTRDLFLDNLKYKIYIKKSIFSSSVNQNNLNNDQFYSNYISKGDILCFDWAINRNIKYNEHINPPYQLSENCNIEDLCSLRYTTQFNRVSDIDYNINSSEILITLEYVPYIWYNTLTTFIIFKKTNHKTGLLNNNSFIESQNGTDLLTKNSIKYNCLSTQPFLVNNKWFTKIFYQGNKCMSPEYTYQNTKKHYNNNIKNSWNTGTQAYNTLSSRKVYIRDMKGINLPYIPLPTEFNNYNQLINNNLSDVSVKYNIPLNIEQITPVKNGEYIIQPPIKSDLTHYLSLKSININGYFSHDYELFDKYNNEEIDIDTIIDNYNNRKKIEIWSDIASSETNKHFNYHSIVLEGIYLGYGGYIEERYSEINNIVNSTEGYKILDISSDNQSNKLIIDLEEQMLNLDISKTDLSMFDSNRVDFINSEVLFEIQYDNLNNNLFNNIKLGEGGEIFKKKINAPLKINNNDYIYLCCPQLSHIKKFNSNITDTLFSKILLTGETNSLMYNTFISGIKEFSNNLLPELNELELAFITNNGDLFDFNGLDHSLTIEITEFNKKIDKIDSISGIIS
jgi:hypothetical protein